MILIKKIVLDVLKPHHPNSIEFTSAVAEKSPGAHVELTVTEVDEKTETVVIVIEGENLEYDTIADAVSNLGGSIHSIDKVEVDSETD
jgi:hypothetical protein